MKHIVPALAALILAACAAATPEAPADAAQPPLASAEAIAAAEAAPLDTMSADAGWNAPFAPFNIIGNIYYVGAAGVSSYLITTPDGHFLLDGGIPQTAPLIKANIAALGFNIEDVKYLLNSHAHFDHAGGLASLQAASGALMVASAADEAALEAGRFPFGPSAPVAFPAVRVDQVIADAETLTLGGVTLTAHLTPGHTPGCTSWSMDVTGADGAAHRAFFHCSASVGGQTLAPESYPGMVEDYRRTFAAGRTLQADVFLANHGQFFDLETKRARQIGGDANAFVDAGALARFTTRMETDFNAELARQQAAAQ
jgi:metallo-beta-lactamase class B